jgi:hypothetical protein
MAALESGPLTRADARVAVLIPCHDEVRTVAEVVRRFRRALPQASIYVFDNASTDGTGPAARAAGATVIDEPRRGKGHVVQAMFRQVDADVYVMVDGDDTYPAEAVEALIGPVLAGAADMVIGSRLHAASRSRFQLPNRIGNHLFRGLLGWLVGRHLTDVLSGYRAFSRRLVRALPLVTGGFEIEAELTMKALQRRFRVTEVAVDLTDRPAGSHSKIRLLRDGAMILATMLALANRRRPAAGIAMAGFLLLAGGAAGTRWCVGSGSLPLVVSAALAVAGGAIVVAGLALRAMAGRLRRLERGRELPTSDPAEGPSAP